ncbi:hypothetical protein Tco_1420373 [Tanacetum coccineum]
MAAEAGEGKGNHIVRFNRKRGTMEGRGYEPRQEIDVEKHGAAPEVNGTAGANGWGSARMKRGADNGDVLIIECMRAENRLVRWKQRKTTECKKNGTWLFDGGMVPAAQGLIELRGGGVHDGGLAKSIDRTVGLVPGRDDISAREVQRTLGPNICRRYMSNKRRESPMDAEGGVWKGVDKWALLRTRSVGVTFQLLGSEDEFRCGRGHYEWWEKGTSMNEIVDEEEEINAQEETRQSGPNTRHKVSRYYCAGMKEDGAASLVKMMTETGLRQRGRLALKFKAGLGGREVTY